MQIPGPEQEAASLRRGSYLCVNGARSSVQALGSEPRRAQDVQHMDLINVCPWGGMQHL